MGPVAKFNPIPASKLAHGYQFVSVGHRTAMTQSRQVQTAHFRE